MIIRNLLYQLSLVATIFLLLSSTIIQPANAALGNGVKGWCTVVSAGVEECFEAPVAACQAQHAAFAPSAIFLGFQPFDTFSRLCSWSTNSGVPAPSLAVFECTSAAYKQVAYQRCVLPEQVVEERQQGCNSNGGASNPTGGTNPILLNSGAKFETENDYVTADNRLKVKRYYRSFQTGSAKVYHANPLGSGLSWRFDFSYELHIQETSFAIAPYMTLYQPDGTSYDFELQTDGSIVPIDGDAAQTPVTLQLVSTLPADLNQMTDSPSQWLVTLADNRTILLEGFKPEGQTQYTIARPIEITSLDGYKQTFQYDNIDALSNITDSLGRTLSFSWLIKPPVNDGTFILPAAPLAIEQITLPDGSAIKYSYDMIAQIPLTILATPTTDRLISTEYLSASGQSAGVKTYHYEDTRFATALTGITDERGIRVASWSYDGDGRAIESKSANNLNNYNVSYTDDFLSATRTVTNPLGKQAIYHFDKQNEVIQLTDIEGVPSTNCLATTKNISYDNQGFIQSSTDEEGNITQYQYDSRGLPLSVTEAFGTAEARTTTTIWHSTLRLPTSITTPNLKTEFTYDSNGRLISRTETDLTTHTVPYSTNGQQRVQLFSYTAQGLLDTIDGALTGNGDVIDYDYDANGFIERITNEVGHITNVTSIDANGLPLSITDPNGIATDFEYDDRRRITKITVQPGTTEAITNIDYDAIGQITKITNPTGAFLSYVYDDAKRVSSITTNKGEVLAYSYDSMGNITNITINDENNVLSYTQSRTYDELGRILETIDANSDKTINQYDKAGNLISINDPENNAYAYAFDALNRLITETDPDNHQTTVTLNSNDEINNVEDARTNITSYVRNGWGEPILIDSPDSGVSTYVYNELGLVTQSTDARGVIVQMSYDNLGRQLTQTYPASPDEDISYVYDDGAFAIGRLNKITDKSGTLKYVYDARGNVTREKKIIAGTQYETRYSYSRSDQILKIYYPSDRQVIYQYNTQGLITDIFTKENDQAPQITVAYDIAYLPFGNNKRIRFNNGLNIKRTFNSNYQLTQAATRDGSTTLDKNTYQYDAIGNITRIGDIINPARTQNFTYDKLNRLTRATGEYGQIDYSYDAVGNRTAKNNEVYTIEAASNRLSDITTGSSTRNFNYSANGNSISDSNPPSATGSFSFIYNDMNRLERVDNAQGTIESYIYNAQGQRITTDQSGVKTHYFYNNNGRILAELDGSGTTTEEYIWLDDIPVAMVTAVNASPTLYYIDADHLNTPKKLRDATKATVWDMSSYPFGDIYNIQGSQSLNVRFAGQYLDNNTGLHYNWNRYYDATTGRYITSDPIGLSGGINSYGYALQNPISNIDPEGLYAIPAAFPLLAKGAAALGKAIPYLSPALAALGLNEAINYNQDVDLQKEIEKEANRREYKRICNEPEPPNLDPCERAKWRLNKAKMCMAARQENTNRWWGGIDTKHNPQLHLDLQKSLENAQADVDRLCNSECRN